MANRIKGITVEIGGDTTGLDKALSGLNKTINNTQSQLKDVNKLLKGDPQNTELLAQKQRLLTDAISQTKEKLETLKKASEQAYEQLNKGEITQEQFDALQREIVATENSLNDLESQAQDTGKQMKSFGSNLSTYGEKMQAVGTKLLAVTGAIVGIGVACVKSAKELDEGYDTIIAKTGATGEKLEELTKIANNLFSSMPVEMADVGSAVGEVNTRFGITGDYLEEVSAQFLKFAELNQTDVSSSIDTVQKAMASFGLSSEEASYVLDVLNKAGQDTGISMDQLSSSLTTNASTMKEMGLGFEESVYFLSQLEVSGVDASQVLTGLKIAMKNASKDGKTLEQALADLDKEMKSANTSQEAMNSAVELFGSKAGPQLAVAIQDGTLSFSDLTKAIGEDSEALGNLSRTYEETLDPWDNMTVAVNELKVAGTELAGELFEVLAPILKSITDVVKRVTEWFGNLSDGQKKAIVIIAGVVASLGPLLIIIGKLITVFTTIKPVIIAVMTAISGVGAPVIILIGLLGVLIAVIIKNWESIKKLPSAIAELMGNILNKVKTKLNEIKTAISSKFKEIINSAKTWGKDMLQGFINGITEKIQALKNKVTEITTTISSRLHFSRPDEGELRDYEKWMPDFIDGMVRGIESNKYKLTDAIQGMSAEMTINPNASMNATLGNIQSLLGQGNVIMLDTGELVGATAKSYNAEFGRIARLEAIR